MLSTDTRSINRSFDESMDTEPPTTGDLGATKRYFERIMDAEQFSENGTTVLDLFYEMAGGESNVEFNPIGGSDEGNNIKLVEHLESNDDQGIPELVELVINSQEAYFHNVAETPSDTLSDVVGNLSGSEEILLKVIGGLSRGSSSDKYSYIIADEGCGVSPSEFTRAFYDNTTEGGLKKSKYDYLTGFFGHGSLASISKSSTNCKLVASASADNPNVWAWTITWKEGDQYGYLTINGDLPRMSGPLTIDDKTYTQGTISKVFNYSSKTTPTNITSGKFLRNLGLELTELQIPLRLEEARGSTERQSSKTWNGIVPNLQESEKFISLSKTEEIELGTPVEYDNTEVSDLGEVELSAFVAKEDESVPKQYFTSGTDKRVLYTVDGKTHSKDTITMTDHNINSIAEDSLLVVDCSNLDVPVNSIFNTSRTGINDIKLAGLFEQKVNDIISNWEPLQEIDNNRYEPYKSLETSPLNNITPESIDEFPYQISASDSEEVSIPLVVDSPDEYWNEDHVSVDIYSVQGSYELERDSGLTLTLTPDFSETDTFTIKVYITDEYHDHRVGESIEITQTESETTDDLVTREDYRKKFSNADTGTDTDQVEKTVDTDTGIESEENLTLEEELVDESLEDICSAIDIDRDERVFFDAEEGQSVYEVVNALLAPYGFEQYSYNQFKRIAGGSKHSSNKITNYHPEDEQGYVTNGYTYIEDIVEFCRTEVEQSLWIPFTEIEELVTFAEDIINSGNISLHSGGGKRYDVQAVFDIVKGGLSEKALQIDAQNHGYTITLNESLFAGKSNTDDGQDIDTIIEQNNPRQPKTKVQIKDTQYFMLVPMQEFWGSREAEYFVGYKAHWNKSDMGQKLINSLSNNSVFEQVGELDGIRVSRRGWATKADFEPLDKGESVHGKEFTRNSNMYVYYDDLRSMDTFFDLIGSEI